MGARRRALPIGLLALLVGLAGSIGPAGPSRAAGPIAAGCPAGAVPIDLLAGRAGHAAVAAGDWVYVIGGSGPGGDRRVVERAAIGPDGSTGVWQAETGLLRRRIFLAAVAAKGWIYAIGGTDGGGNRPAEIERAAIGPDGRITAWYQTGALPQPRSSLAAVVAGEHLYAIGGFDGQAMTARVDRARIQDDGSLGAWERQADLATARAGHGAVVAGDAVFVVGGHDGRRELASVERGAIDPDGAAVVAAGGYLHAIGGDDGRTELDGIERAPFLADGTIGEWQPAAALSTPRHATAAIATGDGFVVIGGVADNVFLSSVERWAIDRAGDLGRVRVAGELSARRTGLAAVAIDGAVLATGGRGVNRRFLATVERAPIEAKGGLGAWEPAPPLAGSRAHHAAVVAGRSVYVIGGEDGKVELATVERAAIGDDGSVGEWQVDEPLTVPRNGVAAVAARGYLYAIGGYDIEADAAPPLLRWATVERAAIHPDGSLGPWEIAGELARPRAHAVALVVGDYLYVAGGVFGISPSGARAEVERALIHPDGSLDPWEDAGRLTEPRGFAAGVVLDGSAYLLGGASGAAIRILDTIEQATVAADGTLGPWTALGRLARARSAPGAVAIDGVIQVLGGESSGGFEDSVECFDPSEPGARPTPEERDQQPANRPLDRERDRAARTTAGTG